MIKKYFTLNGLGQWFQTRVLHCDTLGCHKLVPGEPPIITTPLSSYLVYHSGVPLNIITNKCAENKKLSGRFKKCTQFTDLSLQVTLVSQEVRAATKFIDLSLQIPHSRYQVYLSLITDRSLQRRWKKCCKKAIRSRVNFFNRIDSLSRELSKNQASGKTRQVCSNLSQASK